MEQNFLQKYKTIIIILGLVVIVSGWLVSKHNYFVRQNEAIDNQWAQVENQFQRRFDLIPNIVSTVKGIANQEQAVFGQIADARARYSGASTVDEKAVAAGQVESALARLLVITENYPTLQSSASFRDLTVSLEGTENRISVERMKYNDLVKDLNQNVKVFPASIAASIFGVKEHAYFEIASGVENTPKVDFSQ